MELLLQLLKPWLELVGDAVSLFARLAELGIAGLAQVLEVLLLLPICQKDLLQLLLHLVELQQSEFRLFARLAELGIAGLELLLQLLKPWLELVGDAVSLFARLAELGIAGKQFFPQFAHDGGCLKRGQQVGHGVCLLQMQPQQLAVVKVGFVAQQLRPQFEIAVGVEQLGLHFQQAKDCGGQQRRDGHGRSVGGCRPAAVRHPLMQRRGAVLLQPPAGQ